MPPLNNTELEIFKTFLTFVVLLFTWFLGTRIIHYWDIKKKQKELDISLSSEFQKLYGEFTSVWRLWKVHYDNFPKKETLSGKPEERYWELLKRASSVEGGMESIFVKLASEKILNPSDINSLGLFRQAIQQLRQSIRNYEEMGWQREDKEYIYLKELAIFTSRLINVSSVPVIDKAKSQLAEITQVDSKTWEEKTINESSPNA